MKKLLALFALCALLTMSAAAQNPKTTSKMIYHNGPVLWGIKHMYVIWYGCWDNNCGFAGDTKTVDVINAFLATIGNTPYLQINSTYTDNSGQNATATVIWAGQVFDQSYAHGLDLTDADIQGIIADQINNFRLPADPDGIYIVVASANVASTATGFCSPGARPYHSSGIITGGLLRYIFVGNPNRCPTIAGPQFSGTGVQTPHNSFAGDVLASNIAHALDGTLTNPFGSGWFDRYGLENADKCADTFGPTFLTANGARANIRLGAASGDYLIQENWINDRSKPRCAMFQ